MRIKSQKLYIWMVYIMLCAYMIGPMLAYKVGIPRIDNPLTLLFILATPLIFLMETKRMPDKIALMGLSVTVMAWWGGMHLFISRLSPTQFMDTLFFMVLPCFFYILYLIVSRHSDGLGFIHRLFTVFTLFIALPPLGEMATGIQFVNASGDELSIESGAVKGLFFNPNNLATTAVCLAPAILFFFNLLGRNRKETLTGWGLFSLLGLVVFISASRTAIACYVAVLAAYLAYRRNGLSTLLTALSVVLIFALIPSQVIQGFLLSLNGNKFLERFSSRIYLFLYDRESDNSVSYRQEIYNYFWENPPLLFTGYGPKNFSEYFGGHLSNSLGFENPHSFIIELYLGFGVVALLGFAAYVLIYAATLLGRAQLNGKQRFLALICIGVFLVGGFIPSTIIRLPFIWLPCFLIFIYAVCVPRTRFPLNHNPTVR